MKENEPFATSNSIDTFSKLPNRDAFAESLPQIIESQEKFNSKFAVLVVDICYFHRINSQYGYRVGDTILKKLIALLNSVRRDQDHLFRIGDNRFALVLLDLMNTGHAELAAQKIVRLLIPPFIAGDEKIKVDCTIGVAVYPQHGSAPEQLLLSAESSFYRARRGGETIGIDRSIGKDEGISSYWDIELGLEAVIEKQQLQLFYQPQIALDSNMPVGAEALIRWIHPSKGLINPGAFIPIAEKTGHISKITNWVLNTAMRQSADWTDKWGTQTVSVNIPPDFILQPFLKDFVSSAIKLWSSSNITLVLEIVERSLIKEPQLCFQLLSEIQDMGVRISLDDFGTGYSMLAYFQQIPVNELKIDQSFMVDLRESKANQNIVRLITDLAHSFNMEVVAEGIEEGAILQKVRDYGVDIGQGYYFAKPMPAVEYKKWLLDYSAREIAPPS